MKLHKSHYLMPEDSNGEFKTLCGRNKDYADESGVTCKACQRMMAEQGIALDGADGNDDRPIETRLVMDCPTCAERNS